MTVRRVMTATIKGRAGTAAVEFALVLPMLVILLLGAVQVGFLILSHASMNATMARVPDLARGAASPEDLDSDLVDLAALRLGLGLAQVAFDPVAESWICPADAVDLDEDKQDRPPDCDGGATALRLYTVTGRVSLPGLVLRRDGVTAPEATLTVTAP